MAKSQTEPYLATYLHNMGGRQGLAIGGNFELTSRCNFRCPMCYVHMDKNETQHAGKELTAAQWIDLARQARDQGLMFVLLTGGEPFIRKDFFEIYNAMRAMGLMVSINSNGSLIEGEILRQLIENPPFRINISLYGGCAETYRNMCGQDAFEKVIRNVQALKSAGIDVRLSLSITPYNRQDIARIYQISQELGVHIKAASYMFPSVRVNGQQYGCGNRLSPKEAADCSVEWDLLRFPPEEFALRAQNMKALNAIEMPECSADIDDGIRCRAGHSSFWLTWDGRMLPCGMMPQPAVYPLQMGFDVAWHQLRGLVKGLRMPKQCGVCPKKELCAVCPAVCVTETGAFDQIPAYVCQQTEETIHATWKAYQERSKD